MVWIQLNDKGSGIYWCEECYNRVLRKLKRKELKHHKGRIVKVVDRDMCDNHSTTVIIDFSLEELDRLGLLNYEEEEDDDEEI